jgi:uncharacterized protein YndB with AHSA1/START domain
VTSTAAALTTQVYSVFIRATPEEIWEAITKPEFTAKYFHGTELVVVPEAGRPYQCFAAGREQLLVEGEVLEADPPNRLVHTWLALYDEETAQEQPSRVTWEIERRDGGFSRLTVVHDQLEAAPKTAENVSGDGWMFVLSGLKTLLETGKPLAD